MAAIVDTILGRLTETVLDKLIEEFKLLTGVKGEVENLMGSLKAIKTVLEDAEQKQVVDASVKLWLDDLNDVSCQIDDVLDEWITTVNLKQQKESEENQGDKKMMMKKKKVCFPSPSSCFRFPVKELGRELVLRRDTALTIKELNDKLAQINKRKEQFSFDGTKISPDQLPHRPATTSEPDSMTVGRGKEKNDLIHKLLTGDQERTVPNVIPIIGMGGSGKTHFSRLVFNDQRVKEHFPKRAWVCVSDPFVEVNISKAVIESLDKDNCSKDSNVLETLSKCIGDLIVGERFLLVLDDVWTPNCEQWENLIKPFRRGAAGSTILVTSRKVPDVMKQNSGEICLGKLGDVDCSSLFYNNAGIDISSESQKFQEVGKKVIEKCAGLPLALKTLGSYMCGKKRISEWQEVLESKIWEVEVIEEDVFRPLSLSFNGLTPMIKRCLLYCVIFPKDYMIEKHNLIKLWMSQDYLKVHGNKDMEILGQRCFDDLVKRSFFQDLAVDDDDGQITCKMHDIVHDFLQYLTKNECFTLDVEIKASGEIEVPGDKVRHLTLMHASERECLDSFGHCKSLRTLAAFNTTSICMELILQLKCLRTLNLSDSGIKEFPIEIGGLIHLRYLDLSKNKDLKELPDTMSSLYNLQTLLLVDCDGLKKVELGRLVNLRHLHVGPSFMKLEGLEKLTNLQTLDMFFVNGCEGNKLADLQNLNQLQGRLRIVMKKVDQQVVSEAAAEKSILVNKHRLLHLDLSFPETYGDASVEVQLIDRQILDACQPPSGLESLRIEDYRGTGLSTHWLLSLQSLTTLVLFSCWNCEVLPPLGKLPSLESLEIRFFDVVKKVGVELLGIDDDQMTSTSSFNSFPKLKHLKFFYCDSWSEWEGAEGWRQLEDSENKNITTRTIMPCLSSLRMSICPALKALPDFLWKTPLRTLKIERACEILEDVYKARTGEEWAKISHIPNIQLGGRWIQGGEE